MKQTVQKKQSSSSVTPRPALPVAKTLTLREIQDLVQAAILSGDESVFATILDNSRTTRRTLFGVYKNAYVGRLVEILLNEYEILLGYCGDDQFRSLAEAYIEACPSRSQNARWFGSRLPEFLSTSETYSKHPELAEIAGIEKAVSDAFDATDAAVLGFDGLAQYPPDAWGRLTFTPHPSVTRLDAATNAFAIWKSLKDGETPPETTLLTIAEHLAVWRQDTTPRVRVMSNEETMMWTEACRGVRFDVLCEMLATFDDPENAAVRAAGYLQGWLSTHMLTSAKLVRPKARTASSNVERPAKKPARRATESKSRSAENKSGAA